MRKPWAVTCLFVGAWLLAGCAGQSTGADPARQDGSPWPADGGSAERPGPLPDADPVGSDGVGPEGGASPPPPPDLAAPPPSADLGAQPPAPGGPTPPPVTDPYADETGSLSKCTASTMQWWKGNTSSRDVTFVAFGDPHETDHAPGCVVNTNYSANQSSLMRAAINSVDAAPHVWPTGPGFYREGKVYDHVRGVLVAGDLTQTGSDAAPVGTQLGHDCKEYTAYRGAYGRCGTEGKLKFPVYEGYGNHDFPIVIGKGDPSYHPVVGYLDAITAAQRPGGSTDLYDDPSAGTGHFAWRWDDIWFVNLNLKPGTSNEVIPKGSDTRVADPHGALEFLVSFLASRSNNTTRQIVIASHYGLSSSRIEAAEKTAFCKVIKDARDGTGPFTGKKLSKTYPVVAQIHGHSHNAPLHSSWTCPSPYGSIVIPRFDSGTPLYKHTENGGKLHFTVFRLGSSNLEAVGVGAPASGPTGAWSYTHKTRLAIMNPP